MIIIFVKHYLNDAGIKFFHQDWFPRVKDFISQQQGFIAITAEPDAYDQHCMNITLKFASWEQLTIWVETSTHDDLVDQLDPYRIQDWEVAKIETNNDKDIKASSLQWERVPPFHKVY